MSSLCLLLVQHDIVTGQGGFRLSGVGQGSGYRLPKNSLHFAPKTGRAVNLTVFVLCCCVDSYCSVPSETGGVFPVLFCFVFLLATCTKNRKFYLYYRETT